MRRTINLKEYSIVINYDELNSDLDVEVYDELGDMIESINIRNDEDEDENENIDDSFNLN
jgi:hypothetical protein